MLLHMKSSFRLRTAAVIATFFAFISLAQATLMERPVSSVSFLDTLSDAQKVALRHSDMQVLRISGKSMLPFFGEGSVVVIKKIESEKLHAGMVVVYQNRFGETVAHRLIAQSAAGWVAQGYNNNAADSTLVDSSNLMGVVYATFHSNGQIAPTESMASMMNSTAVALAAPAK